MVCAYFVSDLHLVDMKDEKSQVFLRFLEKLASDLEQGDAEKPTHLFLVGDIFDLWIGSHTYFIEKFSPIVNLIQTLVDGAVSVHFFEGNHDLHLTEFWQLELGVQVHADEAYFELGDQVVRVEHGDLINPDDKGYLFLRSFLRTKGMTVLAHYLPSMAVRSIGERASRASRSYVSTAKALEGEAIRKLIRTHAERCFAQKAFDIMITGHVHVLDDHVFQASGRKVRSVNLGSWFDQPKAFIITGSDSRFIELK